MAFSKNWKQIVVSKGEPFQIEYLDRKFGGRPTRVFEVTEDGEVLVNGNVMDGAQNIVGDVDVTGAVTASTTVTGADLVATDDLDVGGDSTLDGNLTVGGDTDLSAGAVTLPADTVTAAQLADALTAQIPMTATLTVGALVGDGRAVTIQVKDANGVNMALACRVNVWLSATAGATPIGTSTTGLTTTFGAGELALTKLANLDFEAITTALGVTTCTVTDTNGTETRYVNVAVNGVVYSSAAVVTT